MEQNTAVELVSVDEVGAIAISDADRADIERVEGIVQLKADYGAEGLPEVAPEEDAQPTEDKPTVH